MNVVALVISAVLIGLGAGSVVVSDWRNAPSAGGMRMLERLWVLLPAAFLIALLVFTAMETAS